jgi:hypothetical protein
MFFISSTIFVFLAAALLLKKRKDEINKPSNPTKNEELHFFVEIVSTYIRIIIIRVRLLLFGSNGCFNLRQFRVFNLAFEHISFLPKLTTAKPFPP